MPQRIQRFEIAQTAKVFGVLYGIMGLIFMPFVALATLIGSAEDVSFLGGDLGWGFVLFMPVLYAVAGFVSVAFGCWLYNIAAKWLGGIEIVLEAS